MPLTNDFKETIREQAQTDAAFRQSLLLEAVECLLNGDLTTAGLKKLEKRTKIPAKSLPAKNLSAILTALQKGEGVSFKLSLKC